MKTAMHLRVFCLIFAVGEMASHAASPGCSTAQCHGGLGRAPVVHGPVKAQGCDVCHDFGSKLKPGDSGAKQPVLRRGAHPPVFTATGADANAACFICHDQLKNLVHGPSSHAHKVVTTKGCVSCHDPHGSQHKKLLREDAQSQCLKCHQSIHPGGYKYNHAPLTDSRACLNCHSPHGSAAPSLLKGGESKICLSCHEETRKMLGQNPVHHRPVAEGKCSTCHSAHGGEHPGLLTRPYSSRFYVRFSEDEFKLCFSCHKPELATAKLSRTQTEFRHGEMNLHYVHLQQKEKGRACRACHEVHASRSPKLIREWMPFLGVSVPLQYAATKDGGTCTTSCHAVREYRRNPGDGSGK